MDKLIIEINSKTWNFWYTLDEIKNQVENWFYEWFNENEEESYSFKIQ
jgi:hypothetical protein